MKQFKVLAVLVMLFFVLGLTGAYAQSNLKGKIGYVDIGQLFDENSKTKAYDKALEEKYNKYEAERNKRLEKIRDAENKLTLLNKDEKEKQQVAIDKDKADLLEFDRQQQTDLTRERNEKIREILSEIEQSVKAFAQKEGYDILLNSKVLIHGSEALDITPQIMKTLSK